MTMLDTRGDRVDVNKNQHDDTQEKQPETGQLGRSKSTTTQEEGTLNFVFETGSGLRNGSHSVRSQAAKHGWNSRPRAAPKREKEVKHGCNRQSVPKTGKEAKPKRRKIQHQVVFEGVASQQQSSCAVDVMSSPTSASATSLHVPAMVPLTAGFPAVSHVPRHHAPPSPSNSEPLNSEPVNSASLPVGPPLISGVLQGLRSGSLSTLSPTPSHESRICDVTEETQVERYPLPHIPSPTTKTSTTSFLQFVLNEEHPIFPHVNESGNPFAIFPIEWKPFYGRMVERYRIVTYRQVTVINADPNFAKSVCELPLRTAIAENEPALIYALMGSTAAMFAHSGTAMEVPLQWFQRKTVEALNAALSDPKRATSSAAILTVCLIALYESTTGAAQTASSLHQPALKRMVDTRGGLKALLMSGSSGPQLVKYLTWCDRVISSQSGNALVFADYSDESTTSTEWNGIWSKMENKLTALPESEQPP